MTPEAFARIRRLELIVSGRVEGLLQGDHRGVLPGAGREAGDARPYAPGDDVRRIDWNVTARTRRPYVRDTVSDHELEVSLILDLSGSMSFGTALAEKREVAVAAAAVFGFVAAEGGNRIGAVLLGESGLRWIPPRPGRQQVYRILGAAERSPRDVQLDLGRVLPAVARARRRRGLVVVVSDFLADGDWDRPLRFLGERHELVAVQVVDPRERELPDVGVIRMEDTESREQRWVDTSDRRLRRRFAEAAVARQSEIVRRLRGTGAHHVELSTDRDWVADLVRAILLRRRVAAETGRSA